MMINLLQSLFGLKVNGKPKLNMVRKGKAMPGNTRVKIPGGWARLKELQEGSKVIGPKGNVATVTEVLPQGITECYRFTFEDGRTAVSHPLHLWEVYEGDSFKSHVTTTHDIVTHFNEFEYAIPVVGEINGSEKLIGETFINELASRLISNTNTVTQEIMELSYHDRRMIARAMRTYEGCVAINGTVRYITSLRQSAINFQELTWSVGGVAKLEVIDDSFMVTAKHRDIEQDEATRLSSVRLKIVGIEKQHPAETICINIDSEDKLFVVDDWIVTHNLCID